MAHYLLRKPYEPLIPNEAPREVRAHPGSHRRRLSRQPLLQAGSTVLPGTNFRSTQYCDDQNIVQLRTY